MLNMMLKLWKALDESIEYASSFNKKRPVVSIEMTGRFFKPCSK